jgi:hypothetical protein
MEAITMPDYNLKENELKWTMKNALHLRLSEKPIGTSIRPLEDACCQELSGGTTVPGHVPGTAFERAMLHFEMQDWKSKPLPK